MDQLHSSVIVLIIELGEVFRRAMWAVYRIEWEVCDIYVDVICAAAFVLPCSL